ncbi:pseudouridine synthase [uncultured Draconibacterium sp.]|uniref:RluA family pseudouridine synthase n=1 Tax=uncultured Draconibacterium sp. TaxID=1573823 RepID=UPI0025DE0B25|nr:pseudouridine synthase [uncultured Draconibacterium sp.]
MNIPVLYQDEAIIVVEKPIELPVHKNDFMPNDAPYLTKLIGDETGKWIYNVHRLDSKTSGVMVLAFSSEVANVLTKQFEQKEVKKTYFAIVQGNPGEGTFDSKVLVKKKSKFKKPAVTHYKTLRTVQTKLTSKDKTDIELSLVEINPETGRWHQLRQHFAKNRFDIIGDTHHGDFTLNKIILADTDIRRLFLHAGKLEFKHPVTGELVSFESPVPEEFDRLLNFYDS